MKKLTELEILRYMAWNRAKGELYSMLPTYHADDQKLFKMSIAIDALVREVEENALED